MAVIEVRYTYPNEQQESVNGDSYDIVFVGSINTTLWQATGSVAVKSDFTDGNGDKLQGFISKPTENNSQSIIEIPVTRLSFTDGYIWTLEDSTFLYSVNSLGLENATYGYADNWWLREDYQPCREFNTNFLTQLEHWRFARFPFGSPDFSTQIFRYINPVITYWHPANGTPLYKFTIYKDGEEIFSRTEAATPTVILVSEQCPPNTCPVDCGDHVCCYNSEGIATFCYLK